MENPVSSLEEHKADTMKRLGNSHEDVHRYIDHWHEKYGGKHRFMLHHQEGVEEIRQKFGDGGAKAAECHIKMDCGGEGYRRRTITPRERWTGSGTVKTLIRW